MDKVRSEDGTAIAFDRVGEGPPIVLVLGAFNERATGAPLAAALQDRFSIVTYDRRGRGDGADTPALSQAGEDGAEGAAKALARAKHRRLCQ